MATLIERIGDLITAVKTETKAIRTLISGSNTGDVSGLNTTASNLVGAVNEIKVISDAAAGGGVAINDLATNTTDAWSSSKINTELANTLASANTNTTNAIATALEGEDLSDIADAVAANAANAANLATAASVTTLEGIVNNKANTSDIYTRAELGDPDTNFVTLWNAA